MCTHVDYFSTLPALGGLNECIRLVLENVRKEMVVEVFKPWLIFWTFSGYKILSYVS
jgi:hypothetical protein